MQLNAIIVDDEEYSRKSLFFLIDSYCPNVKVRGIAKSVKEARQMLKSNQIDLVFLDKISCKFSHFLYQSAIMQ